MVAGGNKPVREAYAVKEIEPVYEQASVIEKKEEIDQLRDLHQIPHDIKRSDCLEKVSNDIGARQWEPSHPEKSCPGYPGLTRSISPEPTPELIPGD